MSSPLADQLRDHRATISRPRRPAPAPVWERKTERKSDEGKPESAHELVRDALEGSNKQRLLASSASTRWANLPWWHIWQAAGVTILLVGIVGAWAASRHNSDLTRFTRDELASVSPYLESGHRNGDGSGLAFVGTIDDEWLTLSRIDREASAEDMVSRLRASGIHQVMIYDEDDQLKIQSVGSQPVRTH